MSVTSGKRSRVTDRSVRSPDQLDAVAKTTRPLGWVGLSFGLLALVGAFVWSCVATVPIFVKAPGVIVASTPDVAVTSPVKGTVRSVLAQPGQPVNVDTALAIVNPEDGQASVTVKAGLTGQLGNIDVLAGTSVTTGQTIALIHPSAAGLPAQAVGYVSQPDASHFVAGQQVSVGFDVGGAVVPGKITAVATVPASLAQLEADLGNRPAAADILTMTDGAPIRVAVVLEGQPTTKTEAGQNQPPVGARVTIVRQVDAPHPIDLMFGS